MTALLLPLGLGLLAIGASVKLTLGLLELVPTG
jgi:hypothetical protein